MVSGLRETVDAFPQFADFSSPLLQTLVAVPCILLRPISHINMRTSYCLIAILWEQAIASIIQLQDWREGLLVVYPEPLPAPYGHQSGLVFCCSAVFWPLDIVDPFATDYLHC